MSKEMKRPVFILILLTCCMVAIGQTKTSILSGSWNNPAIWLPLGVPTSTNDVLIANGTTISLTSDAAVRSLTIGGGASGALSFSGNNPNTFTVGSNLLVNTLATFNVSSNSKTTHTVIAKGNIVNNGKLDFSPNKNSSVYLLMNAASSQTLSGNGPTTNIYFIHVNLGTATHTAEISTTAFTAADNFLSLTKGIFKLNTVASTTLVPFTGAANIPSIAGLWISSASALVSTSASVTFAGNITMESGRLLVGNASDEDLVSSGGTLTVKGGSLSVSGKYNGGTSPSAFFMSGGAMAVPLSGSTHTSVAPFNFAAAGSTFHLTGGNIILLREGGNGNQDLGYVNTGATNVIVSGGTLQIGDATTPVSQTMTIHSTLPLPNLSVNSSNAHAAFATGTQTITGNVAVNSGSIISKTGTIVVKGNWNNTGGVTTGSSVIHFASDSTQIITRTGGESFDHVIFSGTGIKTLGSALTVNGFSVVSGSTVDVSASNHSLTVKGHFMNNGTVNTRTGTVIFAGTAAQQLGGTKTTTFHDMRVASSSSLTLMSPANLSGALTLASGTLFTNNKAFTLLSTANNNARIAQITGGDIQGNVVLQRYVNGGRTGWALLGAPIGPGLTFSSWDDDMAITCKSCPDGFYNFTSIYAYNESAVGGFDAAGAYAPIMSINTPIVPGNGYWVYVGTAQFTTAAVNIDMTGTPKKGGISIPLAYTPNSNVNDDGWNLIANPYPSPISWNALRGSTPNVDNAIYMYNADLGGGNGGYAAYVNGISSPDVSSGGIGDVITSCQGFFVHATAATTLNALESNKVGGNQQLLRTGTSMRPLLRLTLSGKGRADETVLYSEPGATRGFDRDQDAFKMTGGDAGHPVLSLVENGDLFQVNGVAPIKGTFTMQVKASTGYAGSYTIAAPQLDHFPSYACVTLRDLKTNVSTDLKNKSYVCQLTSADTLPRFVLTITVKDLQITNVVSQPTCDKPSEGAIIVAPQSAGPWNYTWRKGGQVVRQVQNSIQSETFSHLPGGTYELEVGTVGGCDFFSTSFQLAGKKPVFASFITQDTVTFTSGAILTFSNTTVGGESFSWSFGAGSSPVTVTQPSLQLQGTGNLMVQLIASNSTGCKDTAEKVIVIAEGLTAISHNTLDENITVRNKGEGQFLLSGSLLSGSSTVTLFDGGGRLILTHTQWGPVSVDLGGFSPGLYYLQVNSQDQQKTFKLIRD